MKKISLLGSAKDYDTVLEIAQGLEKEGFYVLLFPNARALRQSALPAEALKLIDKGLTYDGFEKIKRADLVLFVNINCYMGNSATLELGYASALSKHVIALNHDAELTRDALFNDVLETENVAEIVKIITQRFK